MINTYISPISVTHVAVREKQTLFFVALDVKPDGIVVKHAKPRTGKLTRPL